MCLNLSHLHFHKETLCSRLLSYIIRLLASLSEFSLGKADQPSDMNSQKRQDCRYKQKEAFHQHRLAAIGDSTVHAPSQKCMMPRLIRGIMRILSKLDIHNERERGTENFGLVTC